MPPLYQLHSENLQVMYREREVGYETNIHKQIEVIFVFSGVQELDIDGASYKVHSGEAAVIFPDTIHRLYQKGNPKTCLVLLIFDPLILSGFFPDLSNCTVVNPIILRDAMPKEAFEAAEKICHARIPAARVGYLYVLISYLLEKLNLEYDRRMPVQDLTQKIAAYMTEHYMQPLTLEILAKTFHINKFYLSHIFSDKLKVNFRSYLGSLRAWQAAKLIRTTDDSLSSISDKVGFGSQRTFNRVFREVHNLSPREYRRQSQ